MSETTETLYIIRSVWYDLPLNIVKCPRWKKQILENSKKHQFLNSFIKYTYRQKLDFNSFLCSFLMAIFNFYKQNRLNGLQNLFLDICILRIFKKYLAVHLKILDYFHILTYIFCNVRGCRDYCGYKIFRYDGYYLRKNS